MKEYGYLNLFLLLFNLTIMFVVVDFNKLDILSIIIIVANLGIIIISIARLFLMRKAHLLKKELKELK